MNILYTHTRTHTHTLREIGTDSKRHTPAHTLIIHKSIFLFMYTFYV